MKLKSNIIQVVKTWHSDIAVLWNTHKLVVVMRDNHYAGENKSKEIIQFFESVGVTNYFSTAHEQCQNGLAEATINTIIIKHNAQGPLCLSRAWADNADLIQLLQHLKPEMQRTRNLLAQLHGGGCTVRDVTITHPHLRLDGAEWISSGKYTETIFMKRKGSDYITNDIQAIFFLNIHEILLEMYHNVLKVTLRKFW